MSQHKVTARPDSLARNIFFSSKDLTIVVMEGLSSAIRIIESMTKKRTKNCYYFFSLSWYKTYKSFQKELKFISEILGTNIDVKKFICMANTPEEAKAARSSGMIYSDLINHNCWLNFNLFCNRNLKTRSFDMVCNARPEKWKRVYLASEVKRLAIIQGRLNRKDDFFDYTTMKPAYLNRDRITPERVNELLNSSECGRCFSSQEGACYSSSEYLLSGLPVVSTYSTAGRNIFHEDYNSIIVDPDPHAINEACLLWARRKINGEYSADTIRDKHIRLLLGMRRTFTNIIGTLFNLHNISEDPVLLFEKNININFFRKKNLYHLEAFSAFFNIFAVNWVKDFWSGLYLSIAVKPCYAD